MEYVDGGSLTDVIETNPEISEPLISSITKEVLKGVEYLHSRPNPIIHRDIKSDNILIGLDGRVKISTYNCVVCVRACMCVCIECASERVSGERVSEWGGCAAYRLYSLLSQRTLATAHN